jgi:hypothetical protein
MDPVGWVADPEAGERPSLNREEGVEVELLQEHLCCTDRIGLAVYRVHVVLYCMMLYCFLHVFLFIVPPVLGSSFLGLLLRSHDGKRFSTFDSQAPLELFPPCSPFQIVSLVQLGQAL